MRPRQTIRPAQAGTRGGFTLTEMLVATALVMLIMTMFAQIYGTALGTMSEQRGMANNDQKARTVSETLRNDLKLRTFRQDPSSSVRGLVPLRNGSTPHEAQRGYFYISENNPTDDGDDVLQFTVEIPDGTTSIWSHEGDEAAYFGKAIAIGYQHNRPPYFRNPVNQPYFDGPFGSGRSKAAEISYFLRHGTLYRRVLLIREPPAYVDDNDVQPKFQNRQRVFRAASPDYAPPDFPSPRYSGAFWRDFDYSVTREYPGTPYDGVLTFNGLSSLSNSNPGPNPTLALPWNRFGHFNDRDYDPANPGATPHHGRPREFEIHNLNTHSVANRPVRFMGRPTLQESSSIDTVSDPVINEPRTWPSQYARFFNRSWEREIDDDGVVVGMQDYARMGDDILLTGVEAFNVEIYDRRANSGAGGFVNLGSGDDVSFTTNWNTTYGPRDNNVAQGRANNVFDTWHPDANMSGNTLPPRFALRESVDPGSWPLWQPDTYNQSDIGTVIFPPTVNRPFVGYRLAAILDGNTGSTEPTWGPQTVIDRQNPPDAAGTGVVWERFDNLMGLEAIRITIRYRDVHSGLARQVTVVQSFIE